LVNTGPFPLTYGVYVSTSYTRCRPLFVDIAARRQATELTKGLSLQSSIDEQQRKAKLSAAVYGPVKLFVCIQRCRYEQSRSVCLFLRSQQKGCLTVLLAQGKDGLEAVLSRQRRGKAEAEARQSEIDVICVILISCTMHM